MNKLDEIIASKKQEVASRKELYPVKLLARSAYYDSTCVSLIKYLQRPELFGIIAEIKRASPSAGDIHPYISVEKLSIGYMQQGASALSVLTDTHFFKGSLEDLRTARKFNFCPILRKDFMIDEYQIHEARSYGADVILLIAKALTPQQTRDLAHCAVSLGLEVLLEVHNEDELKTHLCEGVSLVGVNARDLATLKVNHDKMEAIFKSVPKEILSVAESGISDPKALLHMKKVGFKGFLIGEHFMKCADPARACGDFIKASREMMHAG